MLRLFTLITDWIGGIFEIPYKFIQTIGRWRALRKIGTSSVSMVGDEVQTLSPAGAFFRGIGFVLLVLVAIAAVGGALYGLWRLNSAWELERQLSGPFPWARPYWLPALFLLFLAACAAGWWLWNLIGPLREPTDHRDIHAAWVEGRAALEANGLVLTDLPVYLVVGRPASGTGSFFSASRTGFPVAGIPARGDAPVQVFANSHGIFVACPKVSLLSRLAELLAADLPPPPPAASQTLFDDPPPADDAPAAPAWPREALLLEDEGGAKAVSVRSKPRVVPNLMQDGYAVNRERARLNYLARLVAHNRHPFCGVNGVILLVPFASLENEAATNQAVTACQLDLESIRDGFKVDCPILGVICDLEQAEGASTFFRSVPEDRKDRLLGQPFPLEPDLAADRLALSVLSTLRWTGDGLDRIALKAAKIAGEGSESAVLNYNAALCRFTSAVRSHEEAASRIFAAAALGPTKSPSRFAGGFLAATGADPDRDQAFVAGLVRLLTEQQNYVTWTPAAKAEDSAYRTWTAIGYLTLFVFVLIVAFALAGQVREMISG